MTISRSFEIELHSGGRRVFQASPDPLEIPFKEESPVEVQAKDPFRIRLSRPATAGRCRLRLGSETLATIGGETRSIEVGHGADAPPLLFNEFGETEVVVEEEIPDEPGRFETAVLVSVGVLPRPPVERAFRVMIRDLEDIHEGLAQDLVFRSRASGSLWGDRAIRLNPEAIAGKLGSLEERFRRIVERIERQPSTALVRKRRRGRYRPGDRIDPGALPDLVRDPSTKFDGRGRIAVAGKMSGASPALTLDLPEHRHIAEGLKRLRRRCLELRGHCLSAAALFEEERSRWGRRRPGEISVFERRDLPRIERHRELAERALDLEKGFLACLRSADFLRDAGKPRTPLSPTPAFMGRPAYREAYHALVEGRRLLGLMVDAGGIGIGLRNLASLFEYWCFLLVVRRTARVLSDPDPKAAGAFELVHNLYRPELAPGQSFTFTGRGGRRVRVIYQAEFPPYRGGWRPGAGFVASMTPSPLRPDILVEVSSGGSPPVCLVLDAKSTENFGTPKLFSSMADYRTQILDPDTGYQPVRQAWILHRDESARPLCSLPGYLEGAVSGSQSSIQGAVPCAPVAAGRCPKLLEKVLDRFFEMTGAV